MGSKLRPGLMLLLTLLVALLVACGDSESDSADSGGDSGAAATPIPDPKEPVELTYWAWAPEMKEVVKLWNAEHPNIQVKVSQPAQGDALVTKLTQADKAGNPPDLAQAEYQALPSMLGGDMVADITKYLAPIKGEFADGTWSLVTFGEAIYGIPQDVAPMMLLYREDLFERYGLTVPKTWDEFAAEARKLREEDSKRYMTTFSAGDPGWFAGLSQQAGGQWWKVDGENWTVGITDEGTKKVADYWNGLVTEKAILDQPMYTPQWNKQLNDGTLLAWPTAVWGPGVLEGIAPDTKGKWAMAPLPQWEAGGNAAGFWGGSSTAVMKKSKHPAEAVKFASWLNTDPKAVEALVSISGIYPASTKGQSTPGLQKPPTHMPNDDGFFTRSAEISKTAKGFTWGPNVNVTYQSYKDAFAKAIRSKTPFSGALDAMQKGTVDDMKKAGYKVSG